MKSNLSKKPPEMDATAVIFDMDGCLVDSEPLCLDAIATEMRTHGVTDATPELVGDRFLGVGMSEIANFVQQSTKAAFPADFASLVGDALKERYLTELKLIEGVTPLLKRLETDGFRCAIATGASCSRMNFTLDISRLGHYFVDAACCVDDVRTGKPAPDLFLHAAQKINVKPRNCLVLEDSPHGIEGAVTAGMTALGFVGGSHLAHKIDAHTQVLKDAGATVVFSSLSTLWAFIANWKENNKTQPRSFA